MAVDAQFWGKRPVVIMLHVTTSCLVSRRFNHPLITYGVVAVWFFSVCPNCWKIVKST